MDSLKSHYRLLLGLDKTWEVTSVELNMAAKSVTIALEYRGRGGACPECKADCGLKDHAPERTWRHLDTMQFETILKARIPRVNCSKCGVKTKRRKAPKISPSLAPNKSNHRTPVMVSLLNMLS